MKERQQTTTTEVSDADQRNELTLNLSLPSSGMAYPRHIKPGEKYHQTRFKDENQTKNKEKNKEKIAKESCTKA